MNKEIKTFYLKFRGIDDFNRPVYRVVDKKLYFGSVNVLLPDKNIAPNNTTKEINEYFRNNIKQLELFGSTFNCEPHGGHADNWNFVIID